ncbi:MAG TPA: hypothetical protein VEQ34_12915 [Pyrinomonadaceae bacterium]|nr:hypothetical protein [Pyrinomonadaceae bacterium]
MCAEPISLSFFELKTFARVSDEARNTASPGFGGIRGLIKSLIHS